MSKSWEKICWIERVSIGKWEKGCLYLGCSSGVALSPMQSLRAFISESCTQRVRMQSLTVFDRVNSPYTFVRRLGNSRLSEALISEKWHDWKCEIFTTASLTNTEVRGLCAVVEVLLNSIKKCTSCRFYGQHLMDFAKLKCCVFKFYLTLMNVSTWNLFVLFSFAIVIFCCYHET